MRRHLLPALAVLICLALAAVLTACGSSGGTSTGSSTGTDSSAPSAEKLADEIKGEAASADWGKSIASVEVEKKFRQPVIVITTTTGDEAARDTVNDAVAELLKELSPNGPWYIEVYPTGSDLYVARSMGTKRVGPEPAASPKKPEDIKAWIDATYGSDSSDPVDEAWYASIKSMTYDAGSKTIVVQTSIDQAAPDAKILAFHIVLAVDEAMFDSPQHQWVKVLYSNGGEYLAASKVENRYVK